jgi:Spy/CpxP family protein refolding chaperone
MDTYRKAFDERTAAIRELLSHKRTELVSVLSQPLPDREKIDSLTKEIGIAQTELEKEVINHILQAKEILTPEQQKKFLDLIEVRLPHGEKCEIPFCPSERR